MSSIILNIELAEGDAQTLVEALDDFYDEDETPRQKYAVVQSLFVRLNLLLKPIRIQHDIDRLTDEVEAAKFRLREAQQALTDAVKQLE